MRKTDFTKALTEYFSIYLPTTCGVSPNTTNSYRDTFKQLLLFFQEKKGISANYIELRYLNMELVSRMGKAVGKITERIRPTGTIKEMWRFGGQRGQPTPTGHWRLPVSPPW